MTKKQIEDLHEVVCGMIVMITLNSSGTIISRDSCEKLLKQLKGKKWAKEFDLGKHD